MRWNLGAAVYGLITVGAVMAAESASNETYLETIGGIVVAMLLYWLAASYAELVEWRMAESTRLTFGGLARTMREELPILSGAALTLLTVLLSWAAGATLETAINVALLVEALTIVTIEVGTGLHSKLTGRALLMQALVGATLGVMVLVLRVVLH